MMIKYGKLRALFVGVENYEDEEIQDLNYAIDDASDLKSLFGQLGFQANCLRNPSHDEILDAMRDSTSDLGVGDLFLFFSPGTVFLSVGKTWSFARKIG